jgi:hypothetical protein
MVIAEELEGVGITAEMVIGVSDEPGQLRFVLFLDIVDDRDDIIDHLGIFLLFVIDLTYIDGDDPVEIGIVLQLAEALQGLFIPVLQVVDMGIIVEGWFGQEVVFVLDEQELIECKIQLIGHQIGVSHHVACFHLVGSREPFPVDTPQGTQGQRVAFFFKLEVAQIEFGIVAIGTVGVLFDEVVEHFVPCDMFGAEGRQGHIIIGFRRGLRPGVGHFPHLLKLPVGSVVFGGLEKLLSQGNIFLNFIVITGFLCLKPGGQPHKSRHNHHWLEFLHTGKIYRT